jgi:hypothetical protein
LKKQFLEKTRQCIPRYKCISVSFGQTHGIYRECDICDDNVLEKRHPADFLTDIHTDYNQTWWQSVTMLEDVHTQEVNLTVHLGNN